MKKRGFTGLAIMVITLVFLVMMLTPAAFGDEPDSQEAKVSPEYVAYYFYTTKRCTTCKRIEQFSEEAVTRHFKDLIEAGRLQWQALNLDQPENEHFVKDFQLYTKSVIIAKYNAGKPVSWVNLRDIWRLNRDREKFIDYVVTETLNFMEKN